MVVPVRKVTLACAVALLAALVTAAPASACSCVQLSEDSIARSDAAVVAKLISIEPHGDESTGVVPADFHFRVLDVLKGEKRVRKREIEVRSVAGIASERRLRSRPADRQAPRPRDHAVATPVARQLLRSDDARGAPRSRRGQSLARRSALRKRENVSDARDHG